MATDPRTAFEQTVLDMIEHSAVGAVPVTPAYQDALRHLVSLHQVYRSADYPDGYVTVRSLATLPAFQAQNLAEFAAGRLDASALEPDAAIFDRYVASLPARLRSAAEAFRGHVVERVVHHRRHGGVRAHDPVHTLFLVPGAGRNPGLPGNYLFGSLREAGSAEPTGAGWEVHLHDRDDGAAVCEVPTVAAAMDKLQDVVASAPFHFDEIGDLGFRLL